MESGQQVKPRLRKMVTFTQMNLASAVYVGRMDVIFCMNVLIYFSEQRRRSLVQHFYDTLEPGGYLFPGPFGIHLQNAGEVSSHRAE